MSKYNEFFKEYFEYVTGYFSVPNYLSDILQPLLSPYVWSVFTAIWRYTIGYQRWEKGKNKEVMTKYGGPPNTIATNKEAVKILYWLEKRPVKKLY